MARPQVADAERKAPYAVSLSKRQRDRFNLLGGSAWLQAALDQEHTSLAYPSVKLTVQAITNPACDPTAVTFVDSAGRKYGPYHVGDAFTVDLPAWPLRFEPLREKPKAKALTARDRVMKKWPLAHLERDGARCLIVVGNCSFDEAVGTGGTPARAWKSAAMCLEAQAKVKEVYPLAVCEAVRGRWWVFAAEDLSRARLTSAGHDTVPKAWIAAAAKLGSDRG